MYENPAPSSLQVLQDGGGRFLLNAGMQHWIEKTVSENMLKEAGSALRYPDGKLQKFPGKSSQTSGKTRCQLCTEDKKTQFLQKLLKNLCLQHIDVSHESPF
jgi:hypothetical protein